ncbi:MAG: J domain-containing protein [Peptococcaceae bacterium]|jgi:curved DNA-binding protein|nr:J domain-containing protein [Peptococcaceae bacterium]MDH7524617.1 J domain-containing protein [Peptococcaceae bacterium]
MVATYKDYYKILGVERGATDKEIKAAYRRLARQYHPDLHSGSDKKDAENKFKEINEAYEVLSDPDKRARYDSLGTGWQHGQAWQPPPGMDGFQYYTWTSAGEKDFDFGGFSEFFEALFGHDISGFTGANFRQPEKLRGQDIESELELALEEAYRGGEKAIQLTSRDVCPSCRGTGRTSAGVCASCAGLGSRNTVKTLEVKIPPGIQPGSRIRLKGQGGEGLGGGHRGDLYLNVRIRPHPVFTLNGSDLEVQLVLTPEQAVNGDRVPVPTLDGEVLLTVPPMTRSGQKLRLRGKGWPKKGGGRGDEYVRIQIDIPYSMSQQEKDLYRQLASLRRGGNSRGY